MTAYGDARQSIIWYAAKEDLGRSEMIDLMVLTTGILPSSAARYWSLMEAFYEKLSGNKRSGGIYMPVFFNAWLGLLADPPEQGGLPLYRNADEEQVVGGSNWLDTVLAIEPAYTPVEFVGSSGTELSDAYAALATFAYGQTGGLDRFLLLEGDLYQIYLGESDTEFPGELLPEFGENAPIDEE